MGFGVPRSESHPALLVTTRRGWTRAVAAAVLGMLGIGAPNQLCEEPDRRNYAELDDRLPRTPNCHF